MSYSRRNILLGGAAVTLAGCDAMNASPTVRKLLGSAEGGNFAIQRALSDRMALAPEFPRSALSPVFRANGTRRPPGEDYTRHEAAKFAGWTLGLGGLVERPQALTLSQVRSLPARTQITRHDCVEGWSAIGEWTGVPLKLLLDLAGLKPDARYIVFHCADVMEGGKAYYESIDLVDAFHPQTILAWNLNGQPLPVGNGAPLRLRVERQLGYKQAKYVTGIEAVADLSGIHGGKGGFWEDDAGYQWYAGI